MIHSIDFISFLRMKLLILSVIISMSLLQDKVNRYYAEKNMSMVKFQLINVSMIY